MPKRFVEVRHGADVFVLDLRLPEQPKILCRCEGFYAPLNAQYIIDSLELCHADLIEKVMGMTE